MLQVGLELRQLMVDRSLHFVIDNAQSPSPIVLDNTSAGRGGVSEFSRENYCDDLPRSSTRGKLVRDRKAHHYTLLRRVNAAIALARSM